MIESGSCGGALISTKSECEAAATALDLSDKTATDRTSSTYSYYPPGCVFTSSRDLYVWGGGSPGSCSSYRQCICKSTPPSPPALPPSPPSPPSPPMPPPSPPPLPPPPTWVSGSGCAMVGRCVRSTGYGDGTNYLNNEACTIHNPPAVPISVTNFAVDGSCGWSSSCVSFSYDRFPADDCCWLYLNGPIPCSGDYLSVNGYAGYCETSPQGVVPDPSVPIKWQTDGSGTMAGWELCF